MLRVLQGKLHLLVSGEQSFLDRARAYRAVCVLATQSIASLRYALAQSAGAGPEASEAALANCGSKLFFRSTDTATQERLEKLLPAPPVQDRPHIAKVRTAATLRVGESYALMSDGGWQRRRVQIEPHGRAAEDQTRNRSVMVRKEPTKRAPSRSKSRTVRRGGGEAGMIWNRQQSKSELPRRGQEVPQGAPLLEGPRCCQVVPR